MFYFQHFISYLLLLLSQSPRLRQPRLPALGLFWIVDVKTRTIVVVIALQQQGAIWCVEIKLLAMSVLRKTIAGYKPLMVKKIVDAQ